MNSELVVIGGQLYSGEYVLGSCTFEIAPSGNIFYWVKFPGGKDKFPEAKWHPPTVKLEREGPK